MDHLTSTATFLPGSKIVPGSKIGIVLGNTPLTTKTRTQIGTETPLQTPMTLIIPTQLVPTKVAVTIKTAVLETDTGRTPTDINTPAVTATPGLTRHTKVKKNDIIPFNVDAFNYKIDGVTIRGTSSSRGSVVVKRQFRAVSIIVNSIKQQHINERQKVLALCKACTHSQVRHF